MSTSDCKTLNKTSVTGNLNIQKNTFTRWCNKHLLLVNKQLSNLERGFSDGLTLIALLQVLSGKRVRDYYRWPILNLMKVENVTVAARFMKSEGINVEGIDSKAIVEGNVSSCLRLVWSLICQYSISALKLEGEAEKEQESSPQHELLHWIQNRIPHNMISNVTNLWSDGTTLAALVNSLAPGTCPNWRNWDPNDKVENTRKAMALAEELLDIDQLILPEEITDREADEQSIATYLSQFPLAQLPPGVTPHEELNDTQLEAQESHSQDCIILVDELMGFLDESKEVDKNLTAKDDTDEDEEVDASIDDEDAVIEKPNIIRHQSLEENFGNLVEIKSEKNHERRKDSSPMTSSDSSLDDWNSDDIECHEDPFSLKIDAVELSQLVATIRSPSGQHDNCSLKKMPNGDVGISFTPRESGGHILSVTKHGKHLTNSPFTMMIGCEKNKENEEPEYSIATCQSAKQVAVGLRKDCKLSERTKEVHNQKGGSPSLQQSNAETGAPCELDKSKCIDKIKEKEPLIPKNEMQSLHPSRNSVLNISEADLFQLSATIQYSSGHKKNCSLKRQSNGDVGISFPFRETGQHVVSIMKAGEHITNSPFKVTVNDIQHENGGIFNHESDVSKILSHGDGLRQAVVGKNSFTVNCNDAGNGMLLVGIRGPQRSCEEVVVKYVGGMKYMVTYDVKEVGNYVIVVMWSFEHIPGSPFHFTIV